jgi:hypothetical protein
MIDRLKLPQNIPADHLGVVGRELGRTNPIRYRADHRQLRLDQGLRLGCAMTGQ